MKAGNAGSVRIVSGTAQAVRSCMISLKMISLKTPDGLRHAAKEFDWVRTVSGTAQAVRSCLISFENTGWLAPFR